FAPLGPDEVLLSFAPLNFDASTLELWGALLNGARLVIHPTHAPSLEELASVIERYGVTTLWLTAALFHQFVDAHLEGLRPLRQLLAGGDVLSVPHVVRVRTELPHLRLINGYGPTENTTFTCCYTVPSPDEVGSTVSIGKPVSNTTVYLLDDACRPVPVGVAGRLFTGGDGLARGYLGRPELTAERFLTDPFSTLANARMYDTGDLARWRNDGTIEFLGRADEQLKIRGFRIEPGEIEAALLATGMVRECVVVGRTDAGADKRLVAYVVLPESPPTPASAILELREHIARTLPPYMMPASFVTLDTLPLTSSGKVDRKRLPAPEPEQARARPLVAPRTHLEALLHATWAAVLPTERIGVEDDFFALGGDSILMIRAIARARDAGFRISPRDVYANPTIATLAAFIAASQPAAEETDAIDHELERNVPLTPVQRWFFEGEHVELNHWNQAFLLTVPPAFDVDAIDIAMRAVVNRHEAFRLRFDEHASGWTQRVERSDSAASRFVRRVDLSDLPEDEHADAIARASRDVHASFDVRRGPLIGTVYLDLGAERQGRLFVAAHHLAVDGVSWGVLLSELEAEYRRATDSSVPTAAGRFSRWAARIADYARSADVAGELSYWEQAGAPAAPLPSDRAIDAADDVVANADVVSVQLDEEETRALLQRVPAAYRTQINDVLLSALARTLDVSGDGEVMIDLESHGREDLFVGLDVSRTIGWFTSIFPVRLPASRGPIGASLLAMKERLRAIPRRGIGYGLLRYSAGVQSLRAQPTPQVSFNYLGQMDQVLAGSSLFSFASESTGAWLGARARRRHAVEINAMVMRGRLTFEWSFSRLRHDQGTVATLASTYLTHLRAIVAHCLTEGVGGYSPSDFPLAALTQEQLDRVIGAARDVEDIYPLAPIQRLYHGFADPGDDPGFEQWRYRMSGALDVDALCNAWQLVVDRHAILRTSFVTEGLAEPMQVVRRAAKVAVEQHDWRSSSTEEQAVQVRDLLEADRSRGFDFTRAPLLRLHVIRLGATRYEIVWSHHHLLLDRWSFPLVLRDVRIAYDAVRRRATPAFEPVVPFRDYVAWLAGRGDEAETFWRRIFANYAPTGALAGYVSKEGATAPPELDAAGDMILRLGAERTRALHSFAAAHGVSVNTVVTAAWALWLARQLRTEDVVLGLSVAGRPADIAGVDRMVGVTINNLPLRVRLAARMPVGDWLLDVQRGQADVAHYAHTPLERVHGWSGVPWRLRLFDSILVFQHAGADETNASWLGADVSLSPVPVATHTAYPLSIVIGGSKELAVRVSWDAAQLNAAQAARAGQGLADALQALTTFDTVSAALAALPEPVASAQMRPTDLALAHVPARTATESVLARLLGDLLEIEDVGITDNFFAIGGNSLVATQLASRVRDTLRVEVPVRLVFANPTVEGLAGALAAREAVSGQLEKIAGVVKRVQSMTLDEVRRASTAGAALT
ncbi:MAG TPA: condensation domain-containing protein, partial [Gemmatimonadaceae bacterium]